MTIIRNVGRNVLSESDAEELTSDVFIALWNHADNLSDGSLKAYLGVTARNMAISRLRQVIAEHSDRYRYLCRRDLIIVK